MVISKCIMIIMALFFVLGALDRMIGNKFGLGAEFERGFGVMGTVALSVLGLMAGAPIIAKGLSVIIDPVFAIIGADPAMFPGIIMSCDVGYPLSEAMEIDHELALYGGLVVGSVMGNIISFVIPMACGLIRKQDYKPLAVGVLSAYVVDPLACFVSGLMMGLPVKVVFVNLVPVLAVAVLIVLGLFAAPEFTIKFFRGFSKLIVAVITLGLCAAAVEAMTGFVVISGMEPINKGFQTVGTIVLSIGGSLPLLYVLRKVLRRPLDSLARILKINDITVLSMVMALTTLVPGFADYDKMNVKGRVVFAAFCASAGAVLGCHLGFTAATEQSVVMPMLAAQFISGVLAVISAHFFSGRIFTEKQLSETG